MTTQNSASREAYLSSLERLRARIARANAEGESASSPARAANSAGGEAAGSWESRSGAEPARPVDAERDSQLLEGLNPQQRAAVVHDVGDTRLGPTRANSRNNRGKRGMQVSRHNGHTVDGVCFSERL